jgi:hypothetical protein
MVLPVITCQDALERLLKRTLKQQNDEGEVKRRPEEGQLR